MARSRLAQFDVLSDSYTDTLQTESKVLAYFDSPRISIFSTTASVAADGSSVLQLSVDLRKDNIQAVAFPGNALSAGVGFHVARGEMEAALEAIALGDPPQLLGTLVTFTVPVSTPRIFDAARAQGVPIVILTSADVAAVDRLPISADAKALSPKR